MPYTESIEAGRPRAFLFPGSPQFNIGGKLPSMSGQTSWLPASIPDSAHGGHFAMLTKWCTKCGQCKPLSEFYAKRTGKNGKSTWCKPCDSEWHIAYNAAHPEKMLEHNRKRYAAHVEESRELGLKKRYGISSAEYDVLLNAQQRKCIICGGDGSGKKLYVDHDHKTGKVRALLCNKCNLAIGLLGENASVIMKAFQYIAKWTSKVSD